MASSSTVEKYDDERSETVVLLTKKIEELGFHAPTLLEPLINPVVSLDPSFSSNAVAFEDRGAYQTTFTEEMNTSFELEQILNDGVKYLALLYTYRSCSSAIPQVKSEATEASKKIQNQCTFDVLRPEIVKLYGLKTFTEGVIRSFISQIQVLVKPELAIPSYQLERQLIMVIDLLVKLDALKDMKACLQNDFSRAFSAIRGDMDTADIISEEIQNLQMFLCNPEKPHDFIIWRVKTELFKIGGFDDVLIQLADHCVEAIEKHRYLLPVEKHALYRVILQLLYLLDEPIRDPENDKSFNVFRNKKMVHLERMKKLYRNTPVIYLYGDMNVSIEFVLKKCPHWDAEDMISDWISSDNSKIEESYLLVKQIHLFRKHFMRFESLFSQAVNDLSSRQLTGRTVTLEMMEETYNTVSDGLKLLCLLCAKVTEQTAWKYAKACSPEEYKRQGGKGAPGKEYEQVVKYNYSPDDLTALLEAISMIKSLGALFCRHEDLILPLINRHIHDKIQDFVQTKLARPLRKAYKKKKQIETTMLQMRALAGDWNKISSATDDYLQVRDEIEKIIRDYPRRNVAPSLTQISLIRRMMHTIFDPRAPGMNTGFFDEPDLKPEWAAEWAAFYDESFFYKYMIDYSKTIRDCTDMSFFWFREFYLEMTKQLQFPISMSLPWILVEHILNKIPNASEQLFVAMDLYNDAAEISLKVFNQQFLYDEVEAEANLSFDQLVYYVAEHILLHYKNQAAYVLLDKDYKNGLNKMNRPVSIDNFVRYEAFMAQRNVQLLGRSIDMNLILKQNISAMLRKNLEAIINRFESSDLTCVIELQTQLQHLRMTHELLSSSLGLDSFNTMLSEVNDSVSIGSVRGRIVTHIVYEIVSDLLWNFNYNTATRRFVRFTPCSVVPPADVPRDPARTYPAWYWYGDKLSKQWESVVKLSKGFFGPPHVEAMLQVINHTDLPLIIHEVLNHIEGKIQFSLSSYVTAIMDALPPMKLPSLQLGVIGAYGYFELKLKYIANYGPLRADVFQSMREVGNSLCFVHLVESIFDMYQDLSFSTGSFFLGVRASVPVYEQASEEIPSLLEVYAPQQSPFVAILRKASRTPGALESRGPRVAAPADLHNLEKISHKIEELISLPPVRTSFLTTALTRLSKCLAESVMTEWLGWDADNGLFEVENPRDIARVWSAFQFIFCTATPSNFLPDGDRNKQPPNYAIFGDGWCWAGCAFLHMLGLKERFDVIDFTYFIGNMNSVVPYVPPSNVDPKQTKKTFEQEILPFLEFFVREGDRVRSINEYAFSLFESHFPAPEKPFIPFHPPQASGPKLTQAHSRSNTAEIGVSRVTSSTSVTQPPKDPMSNLSAPKPAGMGFASPPPPVPPQPHFVSDDESPESPPPPAPQD